MIPGVSFWIFVTLQLFKSFLATLIMYCLAFTIQYSALFCAGVSSVLHPLIWFPNSYVHFSCYQCVIIMKWSEAKWSINYVTSSDNLTALKSLTLFISFINTVFYAMYSDSFLILFISIFTALLGEGIQFHLWCFNLICNMTHFL